MKGEIKGSVKGTKGGDQDKRGGKKKVCVYGMVAKRKRMKGWRDGLSFSAAFPSGELW